MEAQLTRRLLPVVLVVLCLSGCADDFSGSTTTTPTPTKDEYAQAVFDTVACIEAAGLTASAAEQFDGSFGIQMTSPEVGPAADADIDSIYDRCASSTHLAEIGTAYLDSIRPSIEEAWEITKDCLVDLGLIDSGASDEEANAAVGSGLDDPEMALLIDECITRPYRQPEVDR